MFTKKRGLKWKNWLWLILLSWVQVKNPLRKTRIRKKKWGNDAFHNGKRTKIRYNDTCATINVTKENIVLIFMAQLENKCKTPCLVFYGSYLIYIRPNSWWIDTGARIHTTNSLQEYFTSNKLSKLQISIVSFIFSCTWIL